MPPFASRRNRQFALLFGAACALTLLAAPAARAFTVVDEGSSATGQNLLDPDQPLTADSGRSQGFQQHDGMTTLKDGNTSLQFGHQQSFEQRYDPSNLFDPMGRPR